MRLKPGEVDAIKAAAVEAFGAEAVVRLFGSRTRDDLRGGDIDLHVELMSGDPDRVREIRFRSALTAILDDEPVDVVVHTPQAPLRWIDRVALREGQVL